MAQQQSGTIPPGWVGGFAQSNPKFAYPNPDLSSLPLLDNLANIDLLQRQQAVKWPEFSWESVIGDPKSRCFQMFAPYISRIGYTNEGRVYSIICPQQGSCSPSFGCLNIEVTVTGQRGWADETGQEKVAADLTVEGKIWFSPSALQNPFVKFLWGLFADSKLPFPARKADAIRVTLHNSDDPSKSILPGRMGESARFKSPDFARHPGKAWSVANLEVGIGPIVKTGHAIVDDFNELTMELVNLASGNLLSPGNVLTWNVWCEEPALVDRQEWREHAEKWRESIDADHGAPSGPGTDPRYFDGTPFKPIEALVQKEIDKINAWLKEHLLALTQAAKAK
ncbi:MAG: hypothetical protein E6G97_12255 [Alphaproteobacteria bacterium]|nr:MAG: hypothetical protein E6G97_12255 [Alphaproteobacteria bacterium]